MLCVCTPGLLLRMLVCKSISACQNPNICVTPMQCTCFPYVISPERTPDYILERHAMLSLAIQNPAPARACHFNRGGSRPKHPSARGTWLACAASK